MNKEKLLERIAELETALSQSMANHNAIAGRLAEVNFLLQEYEKEEDGIIDISIPEGISLCDMKI